MLIGREENNFTVSSAPALKPAKENYDCHFNSESIDSDIGAEGGDS